MVAIYEPIRIDNPIASQRELYRYHGPKNHQTDHELHTTATNFSVFLSQRQFCDADEAVEKVKRKRLNESRRFGSARRSTGQNVAGENDIGLLIYFGI